MITNQRRQLKYYLKKTDALILDHYAIDNWENHVKLITGVKIMVIDGLANRRHNCEILDYTYSQKGKKDG